MRDLTRLLAAVALVALSAAEARADLGDQLAKLLPDDGTEADWFGWTVAISGAAAVVGAFYDDDNGSFSGSAYLFDTTTGQQIAKLLPDDGAASDEFGCSVAISGATAIIGAYFDDDDKNGLNSGSAYLFDATTGRQIAKLLPDDGQQSDQFGNSVGISGTTAIVGGSYGSVYLFNTTTGEQMFKLLPDDAESDGFGLSVAISGATAIVGAPYDDDNAFNAGSAYLFDATTGEQFAELLADDGAADDQLGWSVAISGATAIVGVLYDDDNGFNSGSAYLFDTTTGQQIAKLLPDDGPATYVFGLSVAISGATAIVGGCNDANGLGSGTAYLFDTTMGKQIAKLLPDDGAEGDWFSVANAISGATAIIGAPRDDDNGNDSGSAYLFDVASARGCPWDLNADDLVGSSDLITLLGAWGTDPAGPPDFDGDGSVGTSDLIILLGNWGPCLE